MLNRKIQAYPGPLKHSLPLSSPPMWEMSILGDLTEKEGEFTEKLLDVPRRSSGIIYFDSCGGSAYAGLALASLIRLRGLKVIGIVSGECSSAAIFPFAACQRRYVTPHSTLLFHPIRWQSEDDCRLEEAAEWARHFKILEEDLDQLLVRMLNFSNEKLQEWTRPGKFISGTEIVEEGLAEMLDLFKGDLWEQISK